MHEPDRERTRGFPRFSGPIPGPSWFRPRNFSIEAHHSNIMRQPQTSLRRNEAREQPLPPIIDPQPLCDERELSFIPVISDEESDQRE